MFSRLDSYISPFCYSLLIAGMYEVQYQIPYDAGCTWKETGKMWYDIYTQQLKVCHSGAWRAAATQPGKFFPHSSLHFPGRIFLFYMEGVTCFQDGPW